MTEIEFRLWKNVLEDLSILTMGVNMQFYKDRLIVLRSLVDFSARRNITKMISYIYLLDREEDFKTLAKVRKMIQASLIDMILNRQAK